MSPRRAPKSTQHARQTLLYAGAASLQVSKKANPKFRKRTLRQRRTEDAFREGGHSWRAIFDSSQDGILIADIAQKKFLDCNKRIAKMLGYSRAELLSLSAKDIHPEKELKRALTGFDRLAKGQASVATDIPIKRKDGSSFYADISSSRVEFFGRKCSIGFFRDVTERKRSKEVLVESEEMFRMLTEQSPNMIFINQGGRIVYANPQCEKIMGYKRKELYSSRFNFSALIHPDDLPAVRRNFLTHQKGKEVDPYEYKMVTRGGKLLNGILTSKLIHYHGSPAILGMITDITERKRVEASLAQREAHLSAIIENQSGMVWLKDVDGRYLALNRKYVHTAGIKSFQSMIGKTDFDIWPQELAAKYRADDKRVMRTKKSIIVEEPVLNGGVRKWYETFKTPIMNEKGSVIGTSGYARDISERRRTEEDLKATLSLKRATLESTADGILVVDSSGKKVMDFNDKFSQLWNIPNKILRSKDDEKLRKHVLSQLKDPKRFLARIAELYRHPRKESFDTLEFKDGKIFERYSHPQFLDGKPVGRVWSFRDVTERTLIKRALEESEKRYRTVADNTYGWESWQDPQGRYLYVSPSCKRITGYTAEDFMADKHLMQKIVFRDDRTALTCHKGQVLRKKIRAEFEFRILCADGALRWIHHVCQPVFDKRKKYLGIRASNRDVTERKLAEKALAESERRFRSLFESSQDAMMTLEPPSWKFTSANISMVRMFKAKSAMDLLSHSPWELSPKRQPDGRASSEKAREMIQTAVRKGSNFFEWMHRRIDGTVFLAEVLLTRVEKEEGIFLQATVRDITERKRAVSAVFKAQQFSASVINSLPGIFYVFDSKGKFLRINKKFSEVTQYSLKKILKMHPLDFFSRKEKAAVKDKIREVFEKGESSVEAALLSKDGKRTPYYFTGTRITIDSSPLLVGVGLDISERKKAEDFLKEHRHQLLQVIDTVPHMIFAEDGKGRFLLVNRAVAQAYGKEPKDMVGVLRRDIHKVREEAESYLKVDKEILESGKSKVISVEFFTDVHGGRHVLWTVKTPFKMVGVEEPCILGVSVDVTEQKKVEDFRNEIIRTVSHELRTPLSIEKEGISLLMDEMVGPVNTQQKEILEAVMRSINRLGRMISSLLDVSSIETGKIKLSQKMTRLEPIVKDVMFEFQKRASGKGIDLSMKPAECAVQVLMDPDKITQVLSNLVDNAIKFTPEGGTVQISLILLKNEVECEVRDTGIGIAPENIAKVFEKFQQFSRKDGPGEKGFGLGLSIAKGIIELHGGRIWIKSELGKGTLATFSLPLYQGGKGRGHA